MRFSRTILLAIVRLTLMTCVLMACAKKSASTVIAPSSILSATASLGSAASGISQTNALASTGQKLRQASCPGCSEPSLQAVWNQGKMFLEQASKMDLYSCIANAMRETGVAATLGTGVYVYGTMGAPTPFDIKVKSTLSGGALTQYEVFVCTSGVQFHYATYAVVSLQVSALAKNTLGAEKYRIDLSGTVNNSGWTQKGAVVSADQASGKARFTFDQYAGFLLSTGAFDTGLLQTYAQIQLLGTKMTDYVLGDGSSRYGASGVVSTNAWNGDSGAGVSPASGGLYYSSVHGATLPTVPVTLPTSMAFEASETWNCTTTSPIDLSAALTAKPLFGAAAAACADSFTF